MLKRLRSVNGGTRKGTRSQYRDYAVKEKFWENVRHVDKHQEDFKIEKLNRKEFRIA